MSRLCSRLIVTIAPKILVAINRRILATCLVGSPQTHFFSSGAAFLSLAPNSAKGYYATVLKAVMSLTYMPFLMLHHLVNKTNVIS